MAISYPLALPAQNCIQSVEMEALNAVAVSRSPFTYAEQVHAYSGQQWVADVTLKPMRRADAEAWLAFLLSLRGKYGTFLLGDPFACTPRGTATTATITGSAGDSSVTVVMPGSLLAGDYIQLGSGADARLHKVLVDQTGNGTLEIWPALRSDKTTATVTISNAVGAFRLATNAQGWSVSNLALYGITFAAQEVI